MHIVVFKNLTFISRCSKLRLYPAFTQDGGKISIFSQITTMAWGNHKSHFGSSVTIPRSTVAFPDNNLLTDFFFQVFVLDLIISILCTEIEDCGTKEMTAWQVECKMEYIALLIN